MSAFTSAKSCTNLDLMSNFTTLMNFNQYVVYFPEISSGGRCSDQFDMVDMSSESLV